MDKKELWRLVAFVETSKNRRAILELLTRSPTPLNPTKIAKKLKIPQVNASKYLSELRKENLVECLNPEAPRFRYYSSTEKGKEILGILD